MEYRELGRTGWKISAISLGTWAMGSLWGAVDERESLAALNRALDLGVNFFDTADAYGSEPLLGKRFGLNVPRAKQRRGPRGDPQTPEGDAAQTFDRKPEILDQTRAKRPFDHRQRLPSAVTFNDARLI